MNIEASVSEAPRSWLLTDTSHEQDRNAVTLVGSAKNFAKPGPEHFPPQASRIHLSNSGSVGRFPAMRIPTL